MAEPIFVSITRQVNAVWLSNFWGIVNLTAAPETGSSFGIVAVYSLDKATFATGWAQSDSKSTTAIWYCQLNNTSTNCAIIC